MILRTIDRTTCVAIPTTALTVLTLLAGPSPASAAPCSQWGFAGNTALKQSNGWTTFFTATGARALGATEAVSKSGHMKGTVDGAGHPPR